MPRAPGLVLGVNIGKSKACPVERAADDYAESARLLGSLADYLVVKGMPFRKAHHVVGALVGRAEQRGVPLNQLSLEDYRAESDLFDADALRLFELRSAMARRNLVGAPGTREVPRQVARWKAALGMAPKQRRA